MRRRWNGWWAEIRDVWLIIILILFAVVAFNKWFPT
jgi:hypothetical protein